MRLSGLKDGWGSNGGLWTVPEYSISNGCGDGGNNIKVKEEVVFQGGGGEEWKLGKREASVLRYKEKRQNRLFFEGIRYEVRKINAEKRPRMKPSLPNLQPPP
ncbi:Protein CHLOROPLAST IMPORT APPARATUS 2 [Camellia lanceoleosa]|uniref:Protein CHLOROPLAST IMPORT APPARATUS 2 n=1 Tax=Camellia lanceoleosa TaxID=1840588 RepID=A0ACC0HJT9_9ERIC|nr:Protein CHLOROPLAST IMPORT APPARATUS 2 [Camellia lanceoleosa]